MIIIGTAPHTVESITIEVPGSPGGTVKPVQVREATWKAWLAPAPLNLSDASVKITALDDAGQVVAEPHDDRT